MSSELREVSGLVNISTCYNICPLLGSGGSRVKDKNHWLTQACNIIFNFKNLKDLEVEFMDDSQGFTTCIRSNIRL